MRCDAHPTAWCWHIQPLEANRSSKVTLIWDHFICLLTRMFCYQRNGSKICDSSSCRLPTWTARLARRAPQEYDPDIQTAFAAAILNRLHTGCSLVTHLLPTMERRWQFWKRACLFHISWVEPHTNSPRTMTICTSTDQSWHNQNFWLTIVFG